MKNTLPLKTGDSVPALLPVVIEMVDAWGAAELGLAGSVYNVRVEITLEQNLYGGRKFKLSGEMEGLSWSAIPEAAVLAACLDPV